MNIFPCVQFKCFANDNKLEIHRNWWHLCDPLIRFYRLDICLRCSDTMINSKGVFGNNIFVLFLRNEWRNSFERYLHSDLIRLPFLGVFMMDIVCTLHFVHSNQEPVDDKFSIARNVIITQMDLLSKCGSCFWSGQRRKREGKYLNASDWSHFKTQYGLLCLRKTFIFNKHLHAFKLAFPKRMY